MDTLLVLGERQLIKHHMESVATTTTYGLAPVGLSVIRLLLCDQIVLPRVYLFFILTFKPR